VDFFMGFLPERVASDDVPRKVGALIDWRRVGWKVGKVRSQLGRSGYDLDVMLWVLCPANGILCRIGNWKRLCGCVWISCYFVVRRFLSASRITGRSAVSVVRWCGWGCLRLDTSKKPLIFSVKCDYCSV